MLRPEVRHIFRTGRPTNFKLGTQTAEYRIHYSGQSYLQVMEIRKRRTDRLSETNRAHERVENADGERRTTSERLCHIQFSVWIVIIVLVQKLHVRIVTCHQPTKPSL